MKASSLRSSLPNPERLLGNSEAPQDGVMRARLTTTAAANGKTRQSARIRELGQALISSGFTSLDEQASVLGLPRSTAWTVLKGTHKCSGIAAGTINRMLEGPGLPPLVRNKIHEYVAEKCAGVYGGNKARLARFRARLATIYPFKIPSDAGESDGPSSIHPEAMSPRRPR